MSQERLSALSIVGDKLKQINFDELLHDFALARTRRKTFIAYTQGYHRMVTKNKHAEAKNKHAVLALAHLWNSDGIATITGI